MFEGLRVFVEILRIVELRGVYKDAANRDASVFAALRYEAQVALVKGSHGEYEPGNQSPGGLLLQVFL